MPQDDDLLGPATLRNRAPRILEHTVRASGQTGTEVAGYLGCQLEFEAEVEDPDVNDAVRFRWYVNYNPTGTLEERWPVDGFTGTLPGTGLPSRGVVRKVFRPGEPTDPLTPTLSDRPHRVQLMVFDGELDSLAGPHSQPPAERVPGVDGGFNPRFSTSILWNVAVAATSGACDSQDGGL